MKERPILFSGPMVRAILGRKTQTRRVVVPTQSKPRVAPLRMEPWIIDGERQEDDNGLPCWAGFHPDYPGEAKWFTCPYGQPGDRLWVRETWWGTIAYTVPEGHEQRFVAYRATMKGDRSPAADGKWRPSIFMPRWASRITLEVTAVRVERVQDISEEDARAEGIEWKNLPRSAWRNVFSRLWNEINAARGYGWDTNPWVWVLTLKRI